MTDTYELASRTSVTFKGGDKYKESLINFSGDRLQVRTEMIAFFGLKPSECEGRTDYEIRVMCDQIVQSVATIQNKLGAVLATKDEIKAAEEATAKPGGDPWANVGGGDKPADKPAPTPEPEVDPVKAMVDTISAQTSVKDLQRVWSENKTLFDKHPEIMAAYKTKGKALQAAA